MGILSSDPPATGPHWQQKLRSLVRDAYAWKTPEDLILIGTALLVGLSTGLGAVTFIWLLGEIGTLTQWMQNILGDIAGLLLTMALAGLSVGYVIDRWASEAKGHGVPAVMEAVALRGGHIRPRVATLKVLASSITIGTGGSAGREGPIVQVGAALGSTVGQLFHFSGDRVRTLVACGAAAGIAATFNAPIAGAIFAQEVILNNFTARYFGMVVISGVAASIVSRALLSDKPAFLVPAYRWTTWPSWAFISSWGCWPRWWRSRSSGFSTNLRNSSTVGPCRSTCAPQSGWC